MMLTPPPKRGGGVEVGLWPLASSLVSSAWSGAKALGALVTGLWSVSFSWSEVESWFSDEGLTEAEAVTLLRPDGPEWLVGGVEQGLLLHALQQVDAIEAKYVAQLEGVHAYAFQSVAAQARANLNSEPATVWDARYTHRALEKIGAAAVAKQGGPVVTLEGSPLHIVVDDDGASTSPAAAVQSVGGGSIVPVILGLAAVVGLGVFISRYQ